MTMKINNTEVRKNTAAAITGIHAAGATITEMVRGILAKGDAKALDLLGIAMDEVSKETASGDAGRIDTGRKVVKLFRKVLTADFDTRCQSAKVGSKVTAFSLTSRKGIVTVASEQVEVTKAMKADDAKPSEEAAEQKKANREVEQESERNSKLSSEVEELRAKLAQAEAENTLLRNALVEAGIDPKAVLAA